MGSSDGQRIVIAGEDLTARVWNASTGQLVVKLLGHVGRVWHAEFSSDGQRVLLGAARKRRHFRRDMAAPVAPGGAAAGSGNSMGEDAVRDSIAVSIS
jgi:hypothetical protein